MLLQSWSLASVAKMLPMVWINAVEVELLHETETSFFVHYTWVEMPDKLLRCVELGTHEPHRNIDPLDHLRMPTGFVQTADHSTPLPLCPRVQAGLVLVHLDKLEDFAVPDGRTRPGSGREGEHLGVRPLPWARGSIDGSRSASWCTSIFSRLEGAGGGLYQGCQVDIIIDDKITGFLNGGSGVSPLAVVLGDAEDAAPANPSTGSDVHAPTPCDQSLAGMWQGPPAPVRASSGEPNLDNQEETFPSRDSPGGEGAAPLSGPAAMASPIG